MISKTKSHEDIRQINPDHAGPVFAFDDAQVSLITPLANGRTVTVGVVGHVCSMAI